MDQLLTKDVLLKIFHTERQRWEALLATIDEEHMLQAGVAGHWSVKDVIAHITVYEAWLVEWLKAAQQGGFPPPSVLDDANIDRRNERVYSETHILSLEEVIAQARLTFQELIAVIEAFPAVDFIDPERTAWFMRPYWSRISTLGAAIANLSCEHYQEHMPDLNAWLEKW